MHWASCSHTCACIKLSATSRPYNLILTKWWWWTAAGKVTVGLASHWSRVTDSVIYPYGLNGPRKRGRRYYSRLLQQVDTRQVYVNIKTSQRWTAHSIYRRWTLAYIMIYRITYLSISRLITWWRHAGVWVTSCQAAALSCDCDIEEEDDDDDAMFMLMRHACSPASHCWAAAAAAARCWLALLLTLPPLTSSSRVYLSGHGAVWLRAGIFGSKRLITDRCAIWLRHRTPLARLCIINLQIALRSFVWVFKN